MSFTNSKLKAEFLMVHCLYGQADSNVILKIEHPSGVGINKI